MREKDYYCDWAIKSKITVLSYSRNLPDLKQDDYDAEKKMTANHDDYLMGALLEVALGFHCSRYLIGMKLDFGWNLKKRDREGRRDQNKWPVIRHWREREKIMYSRYFSYLDSLEHDYVKLCHRLRCKDLLAFIVRWICIMCETSFISFLVSFAFSRNRKKEEKGFQIKVYKESREKENNM